MAKIDYGCNRERVRVFKQLENRLINWYSAQYSSNVALDMQLLL